MHADQTWNLVTRKDTAQCESNALHGYRIQGISGKPSKCALFLALNPSECFGEWNETPAHKGGHCRRSVTRRQTQSPHTWASPVSRCLQTPQKVHPSQFRSASKCSATCRRNPSAMHCGGAEMCLCLSDPTKSNHQGAQANTRRSNVGRQSGQGPK